MITVITKLWIFKTNVLDLLVLINIKFVFLIVFIRSSSDTRWKCYKTLRIIVLKKIRLKYTKTEFYQPLNLQKTAKKICKKN